MLGKSLGLVIALSLLGCSSGSGSGGSGGTSGTGGGGASGGSGGGSGGSSGDVCATVCETHAGVCPGDTASCISGCHQGYSLLPNCASQLDAVNACAATRPASDIQCDSQGQPQLKPGVCSGEVAAVQTCLGG